MYRLIIVSRKTTSNNDEAPKTDIIFLLPFSVWDIRNDYDVPDELYICYCSCLFCLAVFRRICVFLEIDLIFMNVSLLCGDYDQ